MCRALNYFQHFLAFVSAASGCVLISALFSLVCAPVSIVSFAVGINICGKTAGLKTYMSIIEKKREKHDEILLIAKTKLNTIKVLISKALIDSYINHDEFDSVNNVLREYNEIKEEI